jgi:hypothetical protein
MNKFFPLLVLGSVLLIGGPAQAEECKGTGVSHADTAKVNGKSLVLNGMGIREATALNINVYVAGLYMPSLTQDASKVINDDVEKKLVLHFVRDVSTDEIAGAWREGMQKNGGLPEYKADLDKVLSWMEPHVVGERMSFTYVPGKGVEFAIKGNKVKGTIAGKGFMKAFFKIWFGDPPNQGLKDGLLGKIACED